MTIGYGLLFRTDILLLCLWRRLVRKLKILMFTWVRLMLLGLLVIGIGFIGL